jgi:hypothetical protein
MYPFYWSSRNMADGLSMLRAANRWFETAAASAQVIEHRTGLMKAAAADPMRGDYRELARMLPEKMAAFSEAGMKLGQGWLATQADMAAQFQQLGVAMMRGRPPSASELQAIHAKGARTASRALAAAGEALAPIHKAATGNARRLKRKGTAARRR